MSLLLVLLAMWQWQVVVVVVSTEHACELAVSSPSQVVKTGCC